MDDVSAACAGPFLNRASHPRSLSFGRPQSAPIRRDASANMRSHLRPQSAPSRTQASRECIPRPQSAPHLRLPSSLLSRAPRASEDGHQAADARRHPCSALKGGACPSRPTTKPGKLTMLGPLPGAHICWGYGTVAGDAYGQEVAIRHRPRTSALPSGRCSKEWERGWKSLDARRRMPSGDWRKAQAESVESSLLWIKGVQIDT